MKVLIALIAAARVAHASCGICNFGRDMEGGAYLHEELTLVTHVEPTPSRTE